MRARSVLIGYGVILAGLVAAYFATPPAQPALTAVFGLVSAGAIVLGVARYRPRRTRAWLLLAGAAMLSALTRPTYDLLPGAAGTAKTGLYIVHLQYLAVVACLVAGLLSLVRNRAGPRDWAAVVDAAILVLGVGLLSWVFLVLPPGTDSGAGQLPLVVRAAYSLGDVLILAAAARFILVVRRSPAALLIICGLAAMLSYSAIFWVESIRGVLVWGTPAEVGWMVYLSALGAAGLHPSMTTVTASAALRPRETNAARLILLALAALIPPTIMVGERLAGSVLFGVWAVIASGVMLLLVLARLALVAQRLRQQSAREHSLREATADLVAAADVAEVESCLQAAVGRLLPTGAPYQLVLVDDLAGAAAPMVGDHGSDGDPALSGAVRSDAVRSGAVRSGAVRSGIVETASLPAEIVALAGSQRLVLAYPLVQDSGARRGLLVVSTERSHLAALRVPVATLSAAVTLALERIRLSGEVIRSASEQYFRALVHNAADVILVVDDNDRVRYASPSAAAIFGARPLRGERLSGLVGDPDNVARLLSLTRSSDGVSAPRRRAAIDEAGWTEHADWTVPHGPGSSTQVEVSSRDLRTDPSVRGLVVTLRDVTEQRRLERELTRQAFHDPLTGLPNRVLFGHRVQEAITRGAHDGTVTGVLLIDLDEFKLINDALGHDAGDNYLVAVARRLVDRLGQRGIAARLGGDEFAALVQGVRDSGAVERIADEIVAALGQPVGLNGQVVACGASVGVATTAGSTLSAPELMHQADLSLYAAKESGRGTWRHYEPAMREAIVKRLELRSSLENALHDKSFAVVYQPIVDLRDGHTVGFEALLRWHHPLRGILTPDEFIDVAEASGLILPIGDWVLRTALAAAAMWRYTTPSQPPYVSVNVSVRQFQTQGFVDQVRAALAEADLPPELLTLEITESLLLRDDHRIWQDLHDLRLLGVKVAIDDFGTGYSALSYLRQVPLDVIKIDRIFISTIASSAQQLAVFEGIVRLADTLGLAVVAEGIETDTERRLAARAGCAFGQGFAFARPMPGADVLRELAARPAILT